MGLNNNCAFLQNQKMFSGNVSAPMGLNGCGSFYFFQVSEFSDRQASSDILLNYDSSFILFILQFCVMLMGCTRESMTCLICFRLSVAGSGPGCLGGVVS